MFWLLLSVIILEIFIGYYILASVFRWKKTAEEKAPSSKASYICNNIELNVLSSTSHAVTNQVIEVAVKREDWKHFDMCRLNRKHEDITFAHMNISSC